MGWIDKTIECLKNNNNKPMTSSEIWDVIKDDVFTKGSTPKASLNTMILGQCVDSTMTRFNNKNRNIFKIVGSNPMKFQLFKFVPDNVRESLINDGFITIDTLREILSKHGIEI